MIVIATILKNNQVLLVKHLDSSKPDYGDWLLPGGSLKPGESLEIALKREIEEETGLEVEIIRKVDERVDPYTGDWLINYLCTPVTSRINMSSELCEVKWFDAQEVKNLDDIYPSLKRLLLECLSSIHY